MLAYPQGGMPGAERLRDSAALTEMVRQQRAEDKPYAAICATPAVAFEHHGESCLLRVLAPPSISRTALHATCHKKLIICLVAHALPNEISPRAGLLKGKRATAHPAFAAQLSNGADVERRVVGDGVLTTSRGPGTAFEFALALVAQLYGSDKAREVAGPMVMYSGWEAAVEAAAAERG